MVADSLFPLRRTAWILILLMEGLLLTTGCRASSKTAASAGADIVIFVDFSASIRDEDKALFEQDIQKRIIPSLSAADRIRIAPINDKTLTDFRPLLEVAFPPKREFTGWLDNVLEYKRKAKDIDDQMVRLRESVGEEVRAIFKKGFSSQQTDIFSSLLIAQKLFRNESRHKVLVLMSDMIEDYPPYNFEKIAWCLICVAQPDGSATRLTTTHDRSIPRPWPVCVGAMPRRVLFRGGFARASNSCRCTW